VSGEQKHEPTECQLERMERLTQLARQAMGYSDDLVEAVALLQQASLVAVDVVRGDATDADLRAACERCLRDLDGWVNVHPMQRALRTVIEGIDRETALGGGGDGSEAGVAEVANALPAADDPPRKERAG